jgi:outer membrane protein assembly factor BamB
MTRQIMRTGTLIMGLLAGPAWAADWPGFRGPGGTGISPETGLPVKWSKAEGLRWKAELPGRGLSNPVIGGGKVFVTASSGYRENRLHVLCFDAATGDKLWERHLASTGNTACHPTTCMAAPTPVTDGKNVYALFATADLVAFDGAGNLLWYRSLVNDYPTITNQVGMAASPTLYRDTLIVPMENVGDSFVAGIDTRTGKNKWKQVRHKGINWVSPVVTEVDGKPSAIVASAEEVSAYDPETGKPHWSLIGDGISNIPSVVAGGGRVFVPGKDFLALKPASDSMTPEVVWKSTKVKAMGYPSPVFHENRIYVMSRVGVNCFDAANGEQVWQQRAKPGFSGTPVIGDGKLYICSNEGTTTVIKLGDKPEVLSANELGDTIMATPAIADGAIFLRSDKYLYCIGAKK